MQNFILDSFAFLVFLNREPGWERVAEILKEAQSSGVKLLMSAINWGEVLYAVWRKDGRAGAEFIEDRIQRSAIEVVLPTLDHVRKAAEFKADRIASYADCFAAALAYERNLPVLTGDPEFKKLEGRFGIKVEWLPPNR